MPVRFVRAMREALAPCAEDGYFCGHTHNQALAYHPGRRSAASWLLRASELRRAAPGAPAPPAPRAHRRAGKRAGRAPLLGRSLSGG